MSRTAVTKTQQQEVLQLCSYFISASKADVHGRTLLQSVK